MAQYIDKYTLVVEIVGRMKYIISQMSKFYYAANFKEWGGMVKAYKTILSFINTFEVKEVDLLTPEEIKKICTIYDNLNQERNRGTILYNSDETFFNHVLMEYKVIAQKGEEV